MQGLFSSVSEDGFSLIELMVAMAILLVGVIPLFRVLARTNEDVTDRGVETMAVLYAQNLLEVIKEEKWDENSSGVFKDYITNRSTIGLDVGETTLADYDDVDDYHTYTDKPHPKLTRTVEVKYVNVPLNGTVTESETPTDNKQVKVTVSWMRRSIPRSKSALSILINGV